jgi:hypothetical protein
MVGTSNQSVPEMAIDIMFGQNKKDGIPWRYIFPILLEKIDRGTTVVKIPRLGPGKIMAPLL